MTLRNCFGAVLSRLSPKLVASTDTLLQITIEYDVLRVRHKNDHKIPREIEERPCWFINDNLTA
jgi:hypothetical protein